MIKIILILTFLLSFASCNKILCYFTNWSQYRPDLGKFLPENIDPYLCTHLIYAFAKLENNKLAPYEWNDDSTSWSKGLYERTTDLKRINPNLKILIAVGGWNMGSAPFINLVSSITKIDQFVSDSVTFLKNRKFDGLDLDWEYPVGYKDQFTTLCQKLKTRFQTENLLLSAAVSADKKNIDLAYDVPKLSNYLDFLNVMSYDYHGSWETFTGHNAPLYARSSEQEDQSILNVNFTISYYIKLGFPAEKIILGLSAYGRSFTLSNTAQNNFGSPVTGGGSAGQYSSEAGFLAYYEICKNLKSGWTRVWNSEHQVPYSFSGNQWVGYDDIQSLKLKIDYAKSKNLGGVMFWAIDLDDFTGSFCGDGNFPLINGVKMYYGNINFISSTINKQTSTKTTVRPVTTTMRPETTTVRTGTTTVRTGTTTGRSITTTVRPGTTTVRPGTTTVRPGTTTVRTGTTTMRPETTTVITGTTTGRSITTTVRSVTSSKASNLCFNGNGYYPDLNSDCKKFYLCEFVGLTFEKVTYFVCPSGLLFDKTTSNCNYDYLVKC